MFVSLLLFSLRRYILQRFLYPTIICKKKKDFSDPVENADSNLSADVAVPGNPTEQEVLLDVTGADVLDETANQPAPTGRGHRRRRPPASLSPGGDFILPPSRRPRLESNTVAIRPAAPSGTVRGRRGRGRKTRSQPYVVKLQS